MRFALAAVVVLVVAAVALVLLGPRVSTLRARYQAEVRAGIARTADAWAGRAPPAVTDDDLARLPAPVAAYLRRAGVVGKPRVVDLHAVMRARFRMARDAPWMDAAVDQWEFFGGSPSRLFLMEASPTACRSSAFTATWATPPRWRCASSGSCPWSTRAAAR
jgi:hypothetical protein